MVPWKTGFEGGQTHERSSEWMPSAATTTSASALAPLANATRATSPSCSKPMARWPVCTIPAGRLAARKSMKSARCMPKAAFQPEPSDTWTGAIGVPS